MPPSTTTDLGNDLDPVLRAEQDHLDRAREELARMRAHTLALTETARGADPLADEALSRTLFARARSLLDDPATALFFGRLDTRSPVAEGDARWYIGRRHVSDAEGDPVVIDWRADVATAFYRATRTEPRGVRLRRRFGIDGGRLSAYEDEHLLDDPDTRPEESGASALLAREIERPRSGPMRDIVATIQPEQDEIVRLDLASTVCVQGAPGTGKTAVGLHRAAWLLYTHRERLQRTGVLVVGPSASFLAHVGAVLPALGEVRVEHTTVEGLVGSGVAVRAQDSPAAASVKGDAVMAEVLRRALRSRVRVTGGHETLVVPRGSRRWRIPGYTIGDILAELSTRAVRYDAARAMLPRRLAHAVLVQMEAAGDSPTDAVQDAVARSRPIKDLAARVWPAVSATALLADLYGDPAFLAEHAEGLLDADQRALLTWASPPRSHRSARWTAADLVLLDEIEDLLTRTPSLGHVVLDEAQDLSAMQLRAVGRRASTGSFTVLGDLAQGTTPWAATSWPESLAHLGVDVRDAHVEVLDVGFRVPSAILDYASRLLPQIAPGLAPARSVRTDPGRLEVLAVDGAEVDDAVAAEVTQVAAAAGTVGVVVADVDVPHVSGVLRGAGLAHAVLGSPSAGGAAGDDEAVDARVQVVPASEAKGLEFDQVVVVEPARIAAAEPDTRTGLRRLYVVLTRAVSGLSVVHAAPLPPALR